MKLIQLRLLAVITALGALSTDARAGLVFSFEDPGVQATTVPGASTEDFESVPLGEITSYASSAVDGTYTSGKVLVHDQYGGAGRAGQYDAVGVGGPYSQTLTFNAPKTYFGLWWSAGDPSNELEFYDGGSLLGSYQVGDLIPLLSPDYFGNPNTGENAGEPYVYLNFTVTGSSRISSVVFNNPTDAGFETDNHSVYDRLISPPGHTVPDGGSALALLGLSAGVLSVAARRCRRA